jgi:hypothetical protein
MTRVARGERKRAYRPKTRTGCYTCKYVFLNRPDCVPNFYAVVYTKHRAEVRLDQKLSNIERKLTCGLVRRIKCDEANPSCSPCISTGRKCDGYGPNKEAPSDLSNACSGALSRSPSVEFLGSEKERRSFHFFQQETAPQLTGFFGHNFWESYLLQAAHHEPSIRHAILALGSLHEALEQDSGLNVQSHTSRPTDDFILENYNQAIKSLVRPVSQKGQQAIDVCLISSILFACLEVSSPSSNSSFHSCLPHF